MLEELGSQTRGGKRWCKKCVDICKYTTIIFPICYLGCMSVDMVLSGQCRQDSKFLETVTVATVRLETVRQ